MGKRVAVIMAGGSGERFWPVSTREKPKQFLRLASPDRSLIQESVARASALVGMESVYVATGRHLVAPTLADCPQLEGRVLAEPDKRNTAGCLVWVTASLMAAGPEWAETTVAVLTADHRIEPEEGFVSTCRAAMQAAEDHGCITTIGISPTRPETGFGYIEIGEAIGDVFAVKQFREKPDKPTAEQYVSSGHFLWNSGMFFFTLPGFYRELERSQPEMAALTKQIAGHLAQGDQSAAEVLFRQLPSISVDYAVMERAEKVMVAKAQFEWDDLGSWDALERSQPAGPDGNVAVGESIFIDSRDNIVYNDGNLTVNLLGVEGLTVVVAEGQVMVCPKDRAQEVKRFLERPSG